MPDKKFDLIWFFGSKSCIQIGFPLFMVHLWIQSLSNPSKTWKHSQKMKTISGSILLNFRTHVFPHCSNFDKKVLNLMRNFKCTTHYNVLYISYSTHTLNDVVNTAINLQEVWNFLPGSAEGETNFFRQAEKSVKHCIVWTICLPKLANKTIIKHLVAGKSVKMHFSRDEWKRVHQL